MKHTQKEKWIGRFQKYYDFFCVDCDRLFDFKRIKAGKLYPCKCGGYNIIKRDLRQWIA